MSEFPSDTPGASQDAPLETPLDEKAKRDQLASEFVDLCDDFYKFSQACAFLCDAFAAVAREPECITEDTSEGFGHVGYWLKCQLRDYREKIEKQQEYWCKFNRKQ
ncbi:hypothetical protein [Thalassomonas sp. RHCl1]|uniref:hypothetical protein n=1 Tax=Thalassomonas sp. RHCl1 TaxID=2995320 RepID=UPI00248BEBD6|nr:hypothetical protein [Thalassomonas sp. RHCl1]